MSVRVKDGEPPDDESVLPPGHRDRSGFWLPHGHEDPRTLVRRRPRRGAGVRRRASEAPEEVAAS